MMINGMSPEELWRRQYTMHLQFCHNQFESRAETVIQQSKVVSGLTHLGPIQALDVCMQVEAEFPGRVQEFIGRAFLIPGFGFVSALIGLIQQARANGE